MKIIQDADFRRAGRVVVKGVLQSAPFRHVFVNGVSMDLYPPKVAMKLMGMSRPTFTKYKKKNLIRVVYLKGDPVHYYVSDKEIERVKREMKKAHWQNGLAKL